MRGHSPQNLDGQTFGHMTVLRESDRRTAAGKRIFVCRCECGAEKEVIGADLKSGRTTSCGCARDTGARARAVARREDITGQTFADGAVIVLGEGPMLQGKRGNRSRAVAAWRCRCKCGKEFLSKAAALRNGQVTSCGCGRVERAKAYVDRHASRATLFGQEMRLSEIAEVSGIDRPTIRDRIYRQGMPIEEAAFAKPKRNGRKGEPRKSVPF